MDGLNQLVTGVMTIPGQNETAAETRARLVAEGALPPEQHTENTIPTPTDK